MNTLRGKLWMLVAVALAALSLLMAVASIGQSRSTDAVEQTLMSKDVGADILPPPLYLVELRLVLSMALDGSMPLDQAKQEVQRLSSEYNARITYWRSQHLGGIDTHLFGAQHTHGQAFIEAAKPVLDALANGDAAGAKAALTAAHAQYQQHRKGVDQTVTVANEFGKQTMEVYQRAHDHQIVWSAITFLASTIALGALSFSVTRSVLRSTGGEPDEVARLANAVANGQLNVDVPVQAGDQHSVMASMAQMCSSLKKIVQSVHLSTDAIATGAQQIAIGNMDLSNRTEQQAANLQQTASAMEEFSGTVQTSAETARKASSLAQAAREAAQKGDNTVDQVVNTMNEISNSSKRIGEITAVINGIAFQTNILALNAAVEAARAGEQGRGFAVVAAEVRNLAQRAATAAKEINDLISQSVSSVEAGTELVATAGENMKDIVNQVMQVTDLIGEISIATSEQTQGIGIVSQAITNLDSSTQQNAALVEESAAAANSLKTQANALVNLVHFFKI